MHLTIFRGTHEVGGTCIEVATGGSRIVLDVGMPLFGPDREPLHSREMRRKSKEELRTERILPKVHGLFGDGSPPDAILLSHAHMDHTGLLDHTSPEIPIFASSGTSKMMLAGRLFADQVGLSRKRFRRIIAGHPVSIGQFRVTSFDVDHSGYGSSAFLIEADNRTAFYSGDLRLHGRKPGMAKKLFASIKGRTVDVLLMEGTHFGLPTETEATEYEVEDEIVDHIRNTRALVLASFSPQHVDRLVGFIRAAKRTNRVFVPDIYTAFVMHLIAGDTAVPRPEANEGIRVYYPRPFETESKESFHERVHSRFCHDRITLDEIKAHPGRYLMVIRPSMIEHDFENNLPEGCLCLFSRWPGYLEQPEWQEARSTIETTEGTLITAHTTGHILPDDIPKFVRTLDARTLIPIHTFEPASFRGISERVQILDDEERYEVQ